MTGTNAVTEPTIEQDLTASPAQARIGPVSSTSIEQIQHLRSTPSYTSNGTTDRSTVEQSLAESMRLFEASEYWQRTSPSTRADIQQIIAYAMSHCGSDAKQTIEDLRTVFESEGAVHAAGTPIDRHGKTILSNLNRLVTASQAAIDQYGDHWRPAGLSALLSHLARKDQVLDQGKDTGRCMLSSLASRCIDTNPAEYARQAVDQLVDGRSQVHFGAEPRMYKGKEVNDYIFLRPEYLERSNGNDVVEAVLQIAHCERFGAFQDATDAQDVTTGTSGFVVRIKGAIGLRPKAALGVFEDFCGVEGEVATGSAHVGEVVSMRFDLIDANQSHGPSHVLHGMQVKDRDNEYVYLYDPLGVDSELVTLTGGLLEKYNPAQALYRMRKEVFERQLNFTLRQTEQSEYQQYREDIDDAQTMFIPIGNRSGNLAMNMVEETSIIMGSGQKRNRERSARDEVLRASVVQASSHPYLVSERVDSNQSDRPARDLVVAARLRDDKC